MNSTHYPEYVLIFNRCREKEEDVASRFSCLTASSHCFDTFFKDSVCKKKNVGKRLCMGKCSPQKFYFSNVPHKNSILFHCFILLSTVENFVHSLQRVRHSNNSEWSQPQPDQWNSDHDSLDLLPQLISTSDWSHAG